MTSQKPVCRECGSENVEAHAYVKWSKDLQDWQIAEVVERGSCPDCGSTDVKLAWHNYPATGDES